MSNLVDHAERELRLAGLFDKDGDYNGMLGESTMKLIKVFADEGHSEMSASIQRQLFAILSNFGNLTPLTDNPDEWMNVSDRGGPDDKPIWQNKRNPANFYNDGGKTYYSVDDKKRELKNSEPYKEGESGGMR